jgi:serine/threonine protein kinase/WD40 repeat protein
MVACYCNCLEFVRLHARQKMNLRELAALRQIMPEQVVPEKSLLFALLAFQNGFIGRHQLLAAFTAWMADKSRAIDVILDEQGAISSADRAAIALLVARHLEPSTDEEDSPDSVLERVHTVREAVLKKVGDDAELSKALQTFSDDETVVHHENKREMADVAFSSNHFRLIKEHARGGLGRVYLAEDLKFGRKVAVKQIRAEQAHNEEYRTKFLLEAEITGQLEHPGIVPVYAMGEDEQGRPFYAMRFIKGEDLKSRIKQFHRQCPRGQMRLHGEGLRQLLRHFIDACHAISYAHDRGVLHRDLKPSNIMLGKHGETLVVDWGLAKPLGVKLNQTPNEPALQNAEQSVEMPLGTSDMASGSETRYGSFVGTAAYAPPEQVLGDLDKFGPTSDVYSLGAILYELLSGQPPLADKDVAVVIRRVTSGDIVPITDIRPDAPLALVSVCRKAMSLECRDRYPTVAELRQDLQRWLDDLPVQAYREPLRQQTSRWMRRHPKWVATVASAIVLGAVGIGIGSLLLEQKNTDLQEKNLALEASQREANQRRLDAELALYDSLVSQSQFLVKQSSYPGWSWEAEQKLNQAATLVSPQADLHRLRSLMLSSAESVDFRQVAALAEGIDCETLCFSRSGRYLAVGQRKHNLASSIFVYDTSDWQLAAKLSISAADHGLWELGKVALGALTGDRHQEGVLALTFSPNDKWLAVGTRLGRIHLWRADHKFSSLDEPTGQADTHYTWQAFEEGGVEELAFTPTGDRLMASSDSRNGFQSGVWNLSDGVWTSSTEQTLGPSQRLVENGRGLLASLTGGQLKWFDSDSLRELPLPSLTATETEAVAFAPTANLVAYAAKGVIYIGDLETNLKTQLSDLDPLTLNGKVGLSFDATNELLAITGDVSQVTVVDTVNGGLVQRVISVPGRQRPRAVFSPSDGLLAVTSQSGVEVYQRRDHSPAFMQVNANGCQQVDDVLLDQGALWAVSQASGSNPSIYQLRQFQAGKAISIASLLCSQRSLPEAKFLSAQPLRVQLTGKALIEREPLSGQFNLSLAVSNRKLWPIKRAQAKLAVPLPLQNLVEQSCLNGPVALVAEDLAKVNELSATLSGQFAYGITPDGLAVMCLRVADGSIVGSWSSELESSLTGNARPRSLDVASELAVVGGSDGIIHVLKHDGSILGRGQWNLSELVSIDASGTECIAGAQNGDAIVGQLNRLEHSLSWQAHRAPVTAVAIVPEAPLYITGSETGEVTLWLREANAVHPVCSIPTGKSAIKRLRLDPSGQQLAIVYDKSSVVHVWNLNCLRQYFDSHQLAW